MRIRECSFTSNDREQAGIMSGDLIRLVLYPNHHLLRCGTTQRGVSTKNRINCVILDSTN